MSSTSKKIVGGALALLFVVSIIQSGAIVKISKIVMGGETESGLEKTSQTAAVKQSASSSKTKEYIVSRTGVSNTGDLDGDGKSDFQKIGLQKIGANSSEVYELVVPAGISKLNFKLLGAAGGGGGGGSGYQHLFGSLKHGGGGGGGGGSGGVSTYENVDVIPGSILYLYVGLGGQGGRGGGRIGSDPTFVDAEDGQDGGETFVTNFNNPGGSVVIPALLGTSKQVGGSGGHAGASAYFVIDHGDGSWELYPGPVGLGGNGASGNDISGISGGSGAVGGSEQYGAYGGHGGNAGQLDGSSGGTFDGWFQNDLNEDGVINSSDPLINRLGVRGLDGSDADTSAEQAAGGGSGGGGAEGINAGQYDFNPGSTFTAMYNNAPNNFPLPDFYCRSQTQNFNCGGGGGDGGDGAIIISLPVTSPTPGPLGPAPVSTSK